MIFNFDDSCWTNQSQAWNLELLEALVLLAIHRQHTILADPPKMLKWCEDNLPLYGDYFKNRLASAQPRAKAIEVIITPAGSSSITDNPPWSITANAAKKIVSRPLRMMLENDKSDKLFVQSTISAFESWCKNGWIIAGMGGGSTMVHDIVKTSKDYVDRWRTFYLFDSDRLHFSELYSGWTPPHLDGCQGYHFAVKCEKMPSEHWHQLKRRSIENYLPTYLLRNIDGAAAIALSAPEVGEMAQFYNMKQGLSGDGILTPGGGQVVRAARSKGFWNNLPPNHINALKAGFGKNVSKNFELVPLNHPWPSDVLSEMNELSDLLQDAM